jgi:hypothetical protein
VGALGIEPRRCAKHAWVTATPGATPDCAPENEKAAEEGFLQGGSRSLRLFQPVLCVWSLPFVGRGLRLALDTHDGPLADEVRLAGPIVTRAHVSHDALAPGDCRGYARDRHGLYKRKASATRARLSMNSRSRTPGSCSVDARGSPRSGDLCTRTLRACRAPTAACGLRRRSTGSLSGHRQERAEATDSPGLRSRMCPTRCLQ